MTARSGNADPFASTRSSRVQKPPSLQVRQPRVDIVDDDPDILEMVSAYLSGEGYLIRTFERGLDALDAWEMTPPDVALVDVILPDIQGLQLITQGKLLNESILFVVMSGYASVELLMSAIRQGIQDYMNKPLESADTVRLVVNNALRRHELEVTASVSALMIRAILRLNELSSLGESRDEFMELCSRAFERILKAPVVGVGYPGGKRGVVRLTSKVALAETVVQALVRQITPVMADSTGTKEIESFREIEELGEPVEALATMLLFPILASERQQAVFLVAHPQERPFRKPELEAAFAFRRTVEGIMEHQQVEVSEEGHMISELTNSLPEAVAVFDDQDHIQYANATFFRLFGQEPGSSLRDLRRGLEKMDPTLVHTGSRRVFHTRVLKTIEWTLPSGQVVLEAGSHAFFTPNRLAYRMVVFRDITHLSRENARIHELNDELTQRNERLAAMIRELDNFAYITSHDLREPFRHIEIFSNYLKDELSHFGQLKGESDYLLGQIVKSVHSATNLLNDLRTLSKVTRMQNPYEDTRMEQLLSDVLERLQLAIEDSGSEVKVGPLPTIRLDPVKFREVFFNLISNAIKYAHNDHPVVEIGSEEHGDEVVMWVKDNGPGIPEEYHDYIFQPCKRIPSPGGPEGSGLGLAIVRRIVEEHGGEVTVESRPGEGARFRVKLTRRSTS